MLDHARFDCGSRAAALRRGEFRRRLARAAGRALGQGARYAGQLAFVALMGAAFAFTAVYVVRAVACTQAQKEPAKPFNAENPVRLERS